MNRLIKKLAISIIILISFSFVVPNYSHAGTIGGKLFQPLAQFVCTVGDLVIQGLQLIFLGDGDIAVPNPSVVTDSTYTDPNTGETYPTAESKNISGGVYLIKYSPGRIFSGTVPGLQVNFINPDSSPTLPNYDTAGVSWGTGTGMSYDDLEKYGYTYSNAGQEIHKENSVWAAFIANSHFYLTTSWSSYQINPSTGQPVLDKDRECHSC